ncbi:acidic mammalian chitinase-like [Physella acuta]|uniref:acidic mammalian chitinase-like n=1 Tax=Physella acuta TaxID=109671 RepID=UPI0027DACA2D|nr:acidic mammalian chitinase-like [Physella acuta]
MIWILLLVLTTSAVGSTFRSVCYYTNWSQYRPGRGKYVPENVDPTLCTHLIYAFAKPDNATIHPFEWNDDSTEWSKGMYERAIDLKQRNPTLKVLLAVGGYNMASEPFTSFVGDPALRAKFVDNSITFLRSRKFDGLDMDWEYPGQRGSPPADKNNLLFLMQELWLAYRDEALRTGQPRLLLTGALPAGKENIDAGYNIPELVPYIDFINVMTYDFHGSWENHTGINSPLFAHPTDLDEDAYLNMHWVSQYYVSLGAPRHKLNIGVGLYGRSFRLVDPAVSGIRAPIVEGGEAGLYTRESGFLSYYEICDMINKGAQVYDVPSQRNKYLVKGDFWVGYDDVPSITEKACYIKQQGFGGIMFWAVDLDDFSGDSCGQGTYPLMRTALAELANPSLASCPAVPGISLTTSQPTTTTLRPTTTTLRPTTTTIPPTTTTPPTTPSTTPSTTPQESGEFTCVGKPNDSYANPVACDSFYICVDQVTYQAYCAMGLIYNAQIKACDDPAHTTCPLGH